MLSRHLGHLCGISLCRRRTELSSLEKDTRRSGLGWNLKLCGAVHAILQWVPHGQDIREEEIQIQVLGKMGGGHVH